MTSKRLRWQISTIKTITKTLQNRSFWRTSRFHTHNIQCGIIDDATKLVLISSPYNEMANLSATSIVFLIHTKAESLAILIPLAENNRGLHDIRVYFEVQVISNDSQIRIG